MHPVVTGAGPIEEPGFANQPVDLTSIPTLEAADFRPVDPNYLRISLISFAVAGLSMVTGAAVAGAMSSGPSTLIWILLAAGLALVAVLTVLRVLEVRNIGYQVRQHDLSYRRGVLVKRVSTVPFVRVQHARIRQGPVQRRFGLATLDVNSAGPDIAINGLNKDVADKMKALVIERAGDLIEDE